MCPDHPDFGEKWLEGELRPKVTPEMLAKATKLFRFCGKHVAWDVARVLILASERGCIEEVHKALLHHYHVHLQLQHEEKRGLVKEPSGVNLTEVTLQHIYTGILKTNEKPRTAFRQTA